MIPWTGPWINTIYKLGLMTQLINTIGGPLGRQGYIQSVTLINLLDHCSQKLPIQQSTYQYYKKR